MTIDPIIRKHGGQFLNLEYIMLNEGEGPEARGRQRKEGEKVRG